jgi:hypothetical protein
VDKVSLVLTSDPQSSVSDVGQAVLIEHSNAIPDFQAIYYITH